MGTEPTTRLDWPQMLEDAIVGRVIACLIDRDFRIEISDQDGGGLFVYAAEDGGSKPPEGFNYWVRLTPGNGPDVITDYTTNLETVLAPANQLAAMFRG